MREFRVYRRPLSGDFWQDVRGPATLGVSQESIVAPEASCWPRWARWEAVREFAAEVGEGALVVAALAVTRAWRRRPTWLL